MYAALLIHTMFCAAVVALSISLRRTCLDLQTLGPGAERENLDAFRRGARALLWKLPTFAAVFFAVVVLGALWGPAWRSSVIGQGVLNTLLVLAGVNVLVAFARSGAQQWSPKGSTLGLLRTSLWSVAALGLFALTLFWRFGG